MENSGYRLLKDSLRKLYFNAPRPWLVGYRGGKGSPMVASLLFGALSSVPPNQRRKEVAILSSNTRAQAMAAAVEPSRTRRHCRQRQPRNGMNRHPDLPSVWASKPIDYLCTEEVWAYVLPKPNPWGNNNRALYKLYANASNGECPSQIETSTPSCANSRFGCWTWASTS